MIIWRECDLRAQNHLTKLRRREHALQWRGTILQDRYLKYTPCCVPLADTANAGKLLDPQRESKRERERVRFDTVFLKRERFGLAIKLISARADRIWVRVGSLFFKRLIRWLIGTVLWLSLPPPTLPHHHSRAGPAFNRTLKRGVRYTLRPAPPPTPHIPDLRT